MLYNIHIGNQCSKHSVYHTRSCGQCSKREAASMIGLLHLASQAKLQQAIWLYIDEYNCYGMLVGLGS